MTKPVMPPGGGKTWNCGSATGWRSRSAMMASKSARRIAGSVSASDEQPEASTSHSAPISIDRRDCSATRSGPEPQLFRCDGFLLLLRLRQLALESPFARQPFELSRGAERLESRSIRHGIQQRVHLGIERYRVS